MGHIVGRYRERIPVEIGHPVGEEGVRDTS